MASIAFDPADVIVGVDTHKDQHVAVALERARTPARRTVRLSGPLPATPTCSPGRPGWVGWAAFGVEGTGSYGLGLARFLRRHAVMVLEVARPPRKGQRRLQGKSDPVDAEHAAREVLAGTGVVTPKTGEGAVGGSGCSRSPATPRSSPTARAMITLKATLVTASDTLRAELEPRTDFALVTACAALGGLWGSRQPGGGDAPCAPGAGLPVVGAARGDQGPYPPPQAPHQPDRPRAGGHLWDRVRLRRRAALCRGRQRRSGPLGGRLRQAVRRLPHPGLLRQDHPAPSTGAATARPTPRCFGSSWSGCAGTLRPSSTSNAAPLRACPSARSSAASSAMWPARSTGSSQSPRPPPPNHSGRIDPLTI